MFDDLHPRRGFSNVVRSDELKPGIIADPENGFKLARWLTARLGIHKYGFQHAY